MDVSQLQYPKKSHRKVIRIPRESARLAELMGIVAGDGGINNLWQLVISLNSEADKEYAPYVVALLEELFEIDVVCRKRPKKKVLVLVCSSVTFVDFLVKKGAVRGNKVVQEIGAKVYQEAAAKAAKEQQNGSEKPKKKGKKAEEKVVDADFTEKKK